MTVKKSADGESRRSPTKKVAAGGGRAAAGRRAVSARAAGARSASVVMQARVEESFARSLVEEDAVVLGLDGASEIVREGLRLVHERALQAAMAAAYDEFYAGEPAPLPLGVAANGSD
jgi:hypothetical protein